MHELLQMIELFQFKNGPTSFRPLQLVVVATFFFSFFLNKELS